jgi:hypothetical protein
MGEVDSSHQNASPYLGGYLVGFDVAALYIATVPTNFENSNFE